MNTNNDQKKKTKKKSVNMFTCKLFFVDFFCIAIVREKSTKNY